MENKADENLIIPHYFEEDPPPVPPAPKIITGLFGRRIEARPKEPEPSRVIHTEPEKKQHYAFFSVIGGVIVFGLIISLILISNNADKDLTACKTELNQTALNLSNNLNAKTNEAEIYKNQTCSLNIEKENIKNEKLNLSYELDRVKNIVLNLNLSNYQKELELNQSENLNLNCLTEKNQTIKERDSLQLQLLSNISSIIQQTQNCSNSALNYISMNASYLALNQSYLSLTSNYAKDYCCLKTGNISVPYSISGGYVTCNTTGTGTVSC